MSNYKDFIINPNDFPEKNNKRKEVEKVKNPVKRSSEFNEIVQIIDEYIEFLKENQDIVENNKTTFENFDNLTGKYRDDAYKKIYEIYLKYINFEKQIDIMQKIILRTINNYYDRQCRELKQNQLPNIDKGQVRTRKPYNNK